MVSRRHGGVIRATGFAATPPDRCVVGRLLGKVDAQKALQRESIDNLLFDLLVRPCIQLAQRQHLERAYRVMRRTTALARIVARRAHRLQCFLEHAPRHDAIQFHQRIPQRPQLALPGLLIETIPAGEQSSGLLQAGHFTSTAAAWGGFANRSKAGFCVLKIDHGLVNPPCASTPDALERQALDSSSFSTSASLALPNV